MTNGTALITANLLYVCMLIAHEGSAERCEAVSVVLRQAHCMHIVFRA